MMKDEMEEFIQQTETLFAEAAKIARSLPDNTVQVWPGGASFTSIQAAINSIKDAGPTNPYSVSVGTGTYKENVAMKANVFVLGAGQDRTIITAAPGPGQKAIGVINSAGDSGIGDLTVTATGGATFGCWTIALKVEVPGKFKATGITFNANDDGLAGNNIRGVVNTIAGTPIEGTFHFGSCIFNVGATGRRGLPIALDGMGIGYITTMSLCTVTASGPFSWGVRTAVGSTATLQSCTITGVDYALIDNDWNSLITANQCTINGPISPGVIVNKVTTPKEEGAAPLPERMIVMPE